MPLSDLIGLLEQYRGVTASNPPQNVQQDYQQAAQTVPITHLADALGEAFRSSDTPPFGEMLSSLFANSNAQQRAGILNQLLSAVGPGVIGSGALGSFAGLLHGARVPVTPEQANQVKPEAVQQLAERAQRENPSFIDQASQFYAQHPKVVQVLGAASLALIMSHLSRK